MVGTALRPCPSTLIADCERSQAIQRAWTGCRLASLHAMSKRVDRADSRMPTLSRLSALELEGDVELDAVDLDRSRLVELHVELDYLGDAKIA